MPALSALTTFTDGTVPHAADLNNLTTNIDTLCQIVTGLPTTGLPVSAKPMVKVFNSRTIAIASGTVTSINFDSVAVSTAGMWYANAPSTVTITQPGWYRIEAQAAWDTGPINSERWVQIAINGTADANVTARTSTQIAAPIPINSRNQAVAFEHLAQGATVQAQVFQNGGASLNLMANTSWGCWLTVSWEAPF